MKKTAIKRFGISKGEKHKAHIKKNCLKKTSCLPMLFVIGLSKIIACRANLKTTGL
jgi:hypothetical protein